MVYEMGESGITIELPMTPEEIAAEDAAYAKVAAESLSENVKVFKMGEGGHPVADSGKIQILQNRKDIPK